MQRIRQFIASLNPERILLSFLLSVVFAWLLKDALTLLLTGKSFAGRALPIQVSILAFLLIVLFNLLLFSLPRLIDWFIQKAHLAVIALALVPLAAYAYMGSFSRFVSDDYASAALTVKFGVIGAMLDWYTKWTGRFSANFVDSLSGFFGPQAMAYQTVIVILAWSAALITVIWLLLPSISGRVKWSISILLSSLILITTFETTPSLAQSLYWTQGMHSVILPLILATILAAILLFRWKQSSPASHNFIWACSTGILAFVAGGFGETYVALQCISLVIVLFFGLVSRSPDFRKKLLSIVLTCLVSSFLAMVIIILAPGNQVRQTYFPATPGLLKILLISAQALAAYLGVMLSSPVRIWDLAVLLVSAVLLGSGFIFTKSCKPVTPIKKVTRNAFVGLLAITLVLVFSCFVPSAYGMSAPPPERTAVIPTFLLVCALTMGGYLIGQALIVPLQKIKSQSFRLARIALWVLFLGFACNIFLLTKGILFLQPEYSRFARIFDRTDEMIRQAKVEGQPSVMIPEVHNYFGLSDFGVGTNKSLDDAVNQYYGIQVIINKNMK